MDVTRAVEVCRGVVDGQTSCIAVYRAIFTAMHEKDGSESVSGEIIMRVIMVTWSVPTNENV